ncbi:glycosyltransferase family 39 protein [Clostridium sp. SHJSY1]|uniref:glycosyltransferase family 39 protein n=1 Tax=Clostridium sp. SHJSY1 TaxID=2942483 RepID=UPI0028765400|nr:glycosyltransferase family 39 protein [Clostridium sp. SHJSY1]MDS0525978.1 glycosyltransferase family 39 protein [Clostridium sp. SHJSY1]
MKRFKLTRERTQITLILILSTILNITNLNIQDFANEYYSAGIKSMLKSFKNFFFVSFDPTGFVSVDKPPVGFWIQAIFAKILGFNTWSVILPQAIAGVVSVGLIYCLIKRYFGAKAGIISALCLSVTPIFVAASRNNTIDNQLVMIVLIASYFLFRAIESGKLKHLIISLILIGVGFNIKMLQAYLPLPAIYLTYFIASKINLKKRMINLSICTVILLIVSLSWAAIVDLVPASNRPYVGSSSNNSEIQLIFGHNGAERFSKSKEDAISTIPVGTGGNKSSIARFFSKGDVSDQISWLLPFALIGFLAAASKEKLKKPFDNERKLSLVFWITYFVPQFLYFSFTKGTFHSYYLTMLAPAIAALAGIGIKYLIELYKESTWKCYLLPIAFMIDGALVLVILSYYFESYSITKILMAMVIVLTFGSSIALIINKNKDKLEVSTNSNFRKALVTIGFIGLLIVPTVWSGTTVLYKMSGSSPSAGLELTKPKNSNSEDDESNEESIKLINYLKANKTNEKYLLVTLRTSGFASKIILETNESVMSIGGFLGTDNIITLDQFKQMVKDGDVRYIMVESINDKMNEGIFKIPSTSQGSTYGKKSENTEIMNWAKENGQLIDKSEWSNSSDNKIANSMPVFNEFNVGGQLYELYDLKGCVDK